MRNAIQRGINGIRKIAAGLRPFGESVWPGVRNDLFVAHESIYSFCATLTRGDRVLDAGCGTGYGTFLLARSGAMSAMGVDTDAWSVRFAQKHYRLPNLAFQLSDIENLGFPDGAFDCVVASNSLEHVLSPMHFLDRLRSFLAPKGRAVIAVPPIYAAQDFEIHSHIRYHRTNWPVQKWAEAFHRTGFEGYGVLHESPRAAPNFRSHLPSMLTVDDFTFTPVPIEMLWQRPSITAIFVLTPGTR